MKLIVVTLMMLAACQQSEPLGVHETIENIHTLNGKTVRVAGYLGECGGYDCALYENKQEKDETSRWLAAVRAHHQDAPLPVELKRDPPDSLGIGAGELICPSPSARSGCYFEFDKKSAAFWNSYVVITGEVTNICRDEKGRPGCTDRGPDLKPVAIARWTPQPRKTL